MLKLNLGCGQNKREGFVNVDMYASFAPDVVWNLEQTPWPFETSSVDEIVMNHVLEHLGPTPDAFFGIIKELYRISRDGAVLNIAVPHPRSDGFTGDPTHVRPITPPVMSLFSKKMNREWQEKGWPNTPLATYLDVDFEMTNASMALTPVWAKKVQAGELSNEDIAFAADSYFNVVSEIQITLVARKNVI